MDEMGVQVRSASSEAEYRRTMKLLYTFSSSLLEQKASQAEIIRNLTESQERRDEEIRLLKLINEREELKFKLLKECKEREDEEIRLR